MAGPVKGIYYDAYVMLDIFSRMIVGCVVHARESAGLGEEFMQTVFGVYGIPKVVHADRGSSMTSKPEVVNSVVYGGWVYRYGFIRSG
ncbi:transposase InsO family protein [Auritidibacter ignavus]|nr:transposase InsO family protein [Auritidibacter ignavus]